MESDSESLKNFRFAVRRDGVSNGSDVAPTPTLVAPQKVTLTGHQSSRIGGQVAFCDVFRFPVPSVHSQD